MSAEEIREIIGECEYCDGDGWIRCFDHECGNICGAVQCHRCNRSGGALRRVDPTPEHSSVVAPDLIWLQWHGDGLIDDSAPVHVSEVTHSMEQVFPGDVQYVRADIVAKMLAEKGGGK